MMKYQQLLDPKKMDIGFEFWVAPTFSRYFWVSFQDTQKFVGFRNKKNENRKKNFGIFNFYFWVDI